MRFAVVDLGGSFIKSALADARTAELEHVVRTPFPPFLEGGEPSVREVDLPTIRRVFDAHVQRLLRYEPSALWISSQMHGVALGDRYVSWQDQRSLSGAYEEFRSRVADPQRIGNELGPGHAATVLFAIGRSDTVRRTPLPLPNALIGSATADETLAASFGVYDLRRRAWDDVLLEALGLDDVEWPRVTRWNQVVGEYRGLPVYSPIGDQQAALLGAGLTAGELSINIGTGSQVSILTETFTAGGFKLRPFIGDRYLATITHIPAGRALNILQHAVHVPWPDIDAAVDALASTDLVIDLSFYPSAFGQRGRIQNIREGNLTPAHLFLAAYENMAGNYAEAARRLVPNGEWGSLVLSGGLAHKSRRLRTLIADRLKREYRLSSGEDETLTGLARLATAALVSTKTE